MHMFLCNYMHISYSYKGLNTILDAFPEKNMTDGHIPVYSRVHVVHYVVCIHTGIPI